MKNVLILTGAFVASALSSQAEIISFTAASADGATLNIGTLAAITEPADGAVITSQSYTVNGLTLDADGVGNDSATFTFAISATGGGDTINWDHSTVTVREYDYNNSTFNIAGEGITFGTISVSGTSSGGQSYALNSAVYTEVSYRRWAVAIDEVSSIVGSSTNIAANTDGVVALNDTFFTTEHVSGGSWNLLNYDFTVDVTAVPEPGTYALLAGLTGLVFVMVRRRRV